MAKEIKIQYSFFADSISKQLKKQKVSFNKETVKKYQQIANCILTLRFHELISDNKADLLLHKNHKNLISELNKTS